MKAWRGGADLLQLSRSAAFGNWDNLKGIVLNLHHSAQSLQTMTL